MASISLDTVGKRYGDLQAVNSVDANIKDGEFICIVGPSGCGKTTTLRIIAGLEEVSDGDVMFGDYNVTNDPPKKRNVGMVFQNLALYPHMTVRENMDFGLKINNVSQSERTERINDAAKMLDIEGLLDRNPGELSGGQQQRVAIGRTIVLNPEVFLLDEPLASLDAKLELHRQVGVTTVYVTHDQEQAMTMSDRVIVMKDGKIQQFAPPKELYNSPNNEFVAHFIGTPSMNFFDCEVVEENGDALVDLDFTKLKLGASTSNRNLVSKKTLRIGIRPEHINLQTADDQSFKSSIKFIEPTGKDKIVHLTIDGSEFKAIVPGDMNVDASQTVRTSISSNKVHIFDPDTGKCIH
jgi:multiple sugar transport system ATP-binding protein